MFLLLDTTKISKLIYSIRHKANNNKDEKLSNFCIVMVNVDCLCERIRIPWEKGLLSCLGGFILMMLTESVKTYPLEVGPFFGWDPGKYTCRKMDCIVIYMVFLVLDSGCNMYGQLLQVFLCPDLFTLMVYMDVQLLQDLWCLDFSTVMVYMLEL